MTEKKIFSRRVKDLMGTTKTREYENPYINHKSYKKITICIAIIIMLLTSWIGIVDKSTEEYVDHSIATATTAFVSARFINAAVSIIQSASIDMMIVSANPGEILDPVNDMVEDFSTVMKISLVSLLSQKILIKIISSNFFKIILTITSLLFIAILYFGSNKWITKFFKLFITIGLLRFLLIIIFVGVSLADSAFIKDQTVAEINKLEQQKDAFQAAQQVEQLSEDKKVELNKNLKQQSKQKENNIHKIQLAQQSLLESQKSLSSAESQLQELSKNRSIMDNLNFMKSDKEYKAAKERQQEAAEQVERCTERLEEYNEQLRDNNVRIEEIQATLSGRNKGSFLGKMKKQIEGIKNSISMENIDEIATNFIDTALRLIALFIIKIIALPLFFLYIVIKGFEKIWQINLPEYIDAKKNEGKETLASMRKQKTIDSVEETGKA